MLKCSEDAKLKWDLLKLRELEINIDIAAAHLEVGLKRNFKIQRFDFKRYINKREKEDDDEVNDEFDHGAVFTLDDLKPLIINFHESRHDLEMAAHKFKDDHGTFYLGKHHYKQQEIIEQWKSDAMTDNAWGAHIRFILNEDFPFCEALDAHKRNIIEELASGLAPNDWTDLNDLNDLNDLKREPSERWTPEFWDFAKSVVDTIIT